MKIKPREWLLILVPLLMAIAALIWHFKPDASRVFSSRFYVESTKRETLSAQEVADGYDTKITVVLNHGWPRPKWWGPYPRPKLSGFGGPILQLSGLDRKFAAMVGLGGGLDIRRRVSIGAAALWLLNPAEAGTTSVGAPQRLNFNFGALLLSVVFARTQRVDFMVGGLIGGGGACLQNPDNGTCYARTAMFVGQPGLAAHIKLAPIVRLAVGLGYRFVAARAWTGPASGRLGAPLGSVMLEFGLF